MAFITSDNETEKRCVIVKRENILIYFNRQDFIYFLRIHKKRKRVIFTCIKIVFYNKKTILKTTDYSVTSAIPCFTFFNKDTFILKKGANHADSEKEGFDIFLPALPEFNLVYVNSFLRQACFLFR